MCPGEDSNLARKFLGSHSPNSVGLFSVTRTLTQRSQALVRYTLISRVVD